MVKNQKIVHVIPSATATAASGWIPIGGACSVQLFMKRSNHSAGSTSFAGQLAVDDAGLGAVTYNKWIDNITNDAGAGTAGEQVGVTRVASKSLASNTTAMMSMSPEDIGGFIKITATETTDGTHDAWLVITY